MALRKETNGLYSPSASRYNYRLKVKWNVIIITIINGPKSSVIQFQLFTFAGGKMLGLSLPFGKKKIFFKDDFAQALELS